MAKKREAAAAVLDMPGVIASYHTNAAQTDYRLFGTNRTRGAERSWFVRHGEELVDTMAEPSGPDVVGLLATDVTYGVIGDHGGHNRLIQNIPMIFAGAGVGSRDSGRRFGSWTSCRRSSRRWGSTTTTTTSTDEAVRLPR